MVYLELGRSMDFSVLIRLDKLSHIVNRMQTILSMKKADKVISVNIFVWNIVQEENEIKISKGV